MLSCSKKWWARIKYIDNFVDYVPVSQIAECDEKLHKEKPFQPQHFTDFVRDKYYLVETAKFSPYDDKTKDTYYAQIGNLGESKEMVRRSIKKQKWPIVQSMHEDCSESTARCDKCQQNTSTSKPRKTLEMCCGLGRNKRYKLLILLCKLQRDFHAFKISIVEQLLSLTDSLKKVKKSLLTDFCIFNSSVNDLNVCSVGMLLEEVFSPIEDIKNNFERALLLTCQFLEYLFAEIETFQNQDMVLHSSAILAIKDRVSCLKSIEQDMRDMNHYLPILLTECFELEDFSSMPTDEIDIMVLEGNMILPLNQIEDEREGDVLQLFQDLMLDIHAES